MTKFILLFLTALTAHAATVRLAWDASPDLTNWAEFYRLKITR